MRNTLAMLAIGLAFGIAGAQTTPLRTATFANLPTGKKDQVLSGEILIKTQVPVAEALAARSGGRALSARAVPAELASALEGYQLVDRVGPSGWTSWRVPTVEDPRVLVERLKKNPWVVAAQPVYRITTLMPDPNDGDFHTMEDDPNLILSFDDPPPTFRRLWHLEDTATISSSLAPQGAWEVFPGTWYTAATKPRNGPLIAVIDTGADMDHPDFANSGNPSTDAQQGGQLEKRWSGQFVGGTSTRGNNPTDYNGHGTHVAGLALAAGNNGYWTGEDGAHHGTIGVGYNSRGVILRVFTEQGVGTDRDAANAIFYAADLGVDVINLSLGTEGFSLLFQDAVTYAWQKGCLVVAAGNEDGAGGGDLGPIYPAACSGALAVTANGPGGRPADGTYAGYGYYVDVAAPGGDLVQTLGEVVPNTIIQFVWSTAVRGESSLNQNPVLFPPYNKGYAYLAGTSMATPIVSGAAGLYYGYRGLKRSQGMVNQRAYRWIQRSAADTQGMPDGVWGLTQGYGSLDVWSLLNEYDARGAYKGSFEGLVRAQGTPIGNVEITARRVGTTEVYSTTTYANGMYRFEALNPGTYTVEAAPFGNFKSRMAIVRPGSDMTAVDLHCGLPIASRRDTTPPVVNKFRVSLVEQSAITLDQWAMDTDTTVDTIRVRIGTTPGGSEVLADTNVMTDDTTLRLQVPNAWVNGQTYYVTGTYVNGHQLSTTASATFVRNAPNPDAQYTSFSYPGTMRVGQTYNVTIRMRNTGTRAWLGSRGAALVAVDPANTTDQFGVSEVPIPSTASTGPGNIRAFTFAVTPTRPGFADFRWRMRINGFPIGGLSQNPPIRVIP